MSCMYTVLSFFASSCTGVTTLSAYPSTVAVLRYSRSFFVSFFFFSSRRRHTRFDCDWSSDVCSSDLAAALRFDGVEVNEQLGGLEGGFEQDHLVQVCPLWHRSEGGRLLDAGLPQEAGARQGREPRPPGREVRGAVSHVRAPRHGHAPRLPLCHAGMVRPLPD